MKKLITKKLIKLGLEENLIVPKLGDDGLIACIGDSWFFFGGSEFESVDPREISKDILINEIKLVLDDFQTEYEDEYLYYYLYLVERLDIATSVIKTDVLLTDDGREFNSGSSESNKMYLIPLSKEKALQLFDEGRRVYFIYPNDRTYRCNCRKVCKDRDYLIDHYDAYHNVCGVAC